jgi:hypothetical protein
VRVDREIDTLPVSQNSAAWYVEVDILLGELSLGRLSAINSRLTVAQEGRTAKGGQQAEQPTEVRASASLERR